MAKTLEVNGHVFTQGEYGLYYVDVPFTMSEDELGEWMLDARNEGHVIIGCRRIGSSIYEMVAIKAGDETTLDDYILFIRNTRKSGDVATYVANVIPEGFLGVM